MSSIIALCALVVAVSWPTHGAVLNFEGLSDLQAIDDFYAGLTFQNAVAAVAGFSLNEAELPPASGTTVALNDGGPIRIEWDLPITDFSGLFTYTAALNLRFFFGGSPVGNIGSTFGNNLALSGEPGSAPNELISFQRAAGFDSLVIDSSGVYGIDDVVYDATQVIPEPGTAVTTMAAFLVILFLSAFRAANPFITSHRK